MTNSSAGGQVATDADIVPSDRMLADVAVNPIAGAALIMQALSRGLFGELPVPGLLEAVLDATEAAKAGNLADQRALLASQTLSLNAIFVELVRRAAANMGEHMHATDHYMRLALKAQAQCRATVEALDRLANGHQQLVKHVHVNEGGQAIVTDQLHHHAGGKENGKLADQPHAQGARSSALPSPDPLGQPLSIPCDQGAETVPHARWKGQRRTTGQS